MVGPLRNSIRRSQHERRCSRGGFTLIELLVVTAIISVLIALLLPAVQMTREAARRTQCQNNLRQLGLALHNFHDVYRVFPASGWTRPGPGNPGGHYISWRAMVLPYLEQSSLHDEYDFKADWWSAENLASGSNPLPVYRCPSTPSQPETLQAVAKSPRPALTLQRPLAPSDYEALMGIRQIIDPDTYSDKEMTRSVMHRNSTVRFADVTDGTSMTIVLTECAARPGVYRRRQRVSGVRNDQGYGWIDSESAFSLDGATEDGLRQGEGLPQTPRPMNVTNENEPYSFHSGGAYFLFTDGHVQFLSESMDLKLLAALITRSAGEITAGF